ncbi:MAG: BLUF domain-containing protein [Gemmatirosa sp.]|nr:BLUF domain-containing protein [Gemmatirosa sp.]
MEPLIHLIYASTAVGSPSDEALAELLGAARRKNERRGLTGMLLYTEGTFFQVLEGPPDAVDGAFAAIAEDVRHTRAVTIIRERIPRRAFGEWTMGFLTATPRELGATMGMNDFFAQAACFDRLDAGRAKKLLTAFRAGRWRARLADTPAAA